MVDDHSDGSLFEISLGVVIFCLLVLGAAYGLALVAECLTKNVLMINSDHFNSFLMVHSFAYLILVSTVTAIVMLGGLWAFHWLFKGAGLPWLEAVFAVAGVVLAGLFPFDLCQYF